MAIFNPQVTPGRDDMPNFTKTSAPISELTADKSAGLALATAGSTVEGLAGVAETTAKDIINKDVRSKVEPIRDEFTSQLEALRNIQKNSIVPPAAPVDVMDSNASADVPKVPVGIDNGLSKIQSIQNAVETNARGVNDTYYDLRLKTAVTELRSKYPGFVDYIDSRVSGITGINPANDYVKNLMQDLNARTAAKKTEEDKVLDVARKAIGDGFDGAAGMYMKLKANPTPEASNEFMEWYGNESMKREKLRYENLQFENKDKAGKATIADRKEMFSNFVGSHIDSNINGIVSVAGAKPEKIMDILRQAQDNPNYYTPVQWEEFATKIQLHSDALRSQLSLLASQKGYRSKIGSTDVDNEIDSQIKGTFGQFYNSVKGGGPAGAGLAFLQMNQVLRMHDQNNYRVANTPLGKSLDTFDIVSQKAGPALTGKIIVPAILEAEKDMPEKAKGLFTDLSMSMRAQPNGPNDPTTVTQHINDINNNKTIPKEVKPYIYKGLINVVKDITNPDMPAEIKSNVVKSLFSPGNNGVLQNFNMDYRTTSPDGRLKIEHPGKYAVWTQLTDKKVTDAISKLPEEDQAHYRNWVDITGRELIGQDVRTLKTMSGHDNLYFEWHGEDPINKLVLKDKEGGLASPVGKTATPGMPVRPSAEMTGYLGQVQQVVSRINKALPNLEHVYSSMGGGQSEVMLLETLKQYGMDFEGRVTGLPKAFGDAIAASRKPLKPKAE